MIRPPHYLHIWQTLGWILLTLVLVLSLMPHPPKLDLPRLLAWDKAQHALAYASLDCVVSAVHPHPLAHATIVAGCRRRSGVSAALEWLSRFRVCRHAGRCVRYCRRIGGGSLYTRRAFDSVAGPSRLHLPAPPALTGTRLRHRPDGVHARAATAPRCHPRREPAPAPTRTAGPTGD